MVVILAIAGPAAVVVLCWHRLRPLVARLAAWHAADRVAVPVGLVSLGLFVAASRLASSAEWKWSLRATDLVDAPVPSHDALWVDAGLVVAYVAFGFAAHVGTLARARRIEGVDPARFRPLAFRLTRWSSGSVTALVAGGFADLSENLGTAIASRDGDRSAALLTAIQVAAWTKWLCIVPGLALLVCGAYVGIRRCLDMGIPWSSTEPPAPFPTDGRWWSGRQDRPVPSPVPESAASSPPNEWLTPKDGSRTGICLSGGGIRSASFSLGAMQAIGRSRLNTRGIDYVASVSGGGYMAAAMAALSRNPDGSGLQRPFRRRSAEERWVRYHTDYLVSSGGAVVGALLALVGGMLVNAVLVLLVAQAVAHPAGWVIGVAHPELRSNKNVVVVDQQARARIARVEAVRVEVPTAPVCDDCVRGREMGDAFEVTLVPDDVPRSGEDSAGMRVRTAPSPRVALGDPVDVEVAYTPALVAEGPKGLFVVRQPLMRLGGSSVSNRERAIFDRLRVTTDPRISVVAAPELSLAGGPGLMSATDVRRLVTVDRQPDVQPRTRASMQRDLWLRPWIWWTTGVLFAAAGLAWVATLGRSTRRPAYLPAQSLIALAVLAVVLLVALPIVAHSLPSWLSRIPGFRPGSTQWGTLAALVATVVPLVIRFHGNLSRWMVLRRFRGRAIVIDGFLGLVVVVTGLAAFSTFVRDAAANGPQGRIEGVLEGLLPDTTDFWRWVIVLVALVAALAAPVAAHAWSLYTTYENGLGRAYFIKREPESATDVRRYRIARMRRDERRAWRWSADTRLRLLDATNREIDERSKTSGEPASGSTASSEDGPEWIVCTTVNIRGSGEAAPGRAAGSFTFSQRWVGGPEVGWMPTDQYTARLHARRRRDVCVPSTVAISGAAFSPAMGKASRGWQGRLFALLNLRLGVWVPNPMVVERSDVDGSFGRFRQPSVGWYLRELVGWFDRTAPYVYLTDGGHWENLGLVELLRRGCTDIWMISAAGDGADSFETLSQALALAREELQIDFDIEVEPLRPASDPPDGRRLMRNGANTPVAPASFVTGTFQYNNGISGTLHVVEAALLNDLPWDVHGYAESNEDFPDISTGYQLMHHRDFEAYRMLGFAQTVRALAAAELWPNATPLVPSREEPPTTPDPSAVAVAAAAAALAASAAARAAGPPPTP